jgi:hypothetical protein
MAEDQSLKFRARLDRQSKITLNFQQPTVISLGIEELSGTAQLVNTVPNGGGAYPLLQFRDVILDIGGGNLGGRSCL